MLTSLGSVARAATTGRQRRVNEAGVRTPGLLHIGDSCSRMTRRHASRQLETGGCPSTMSGSSPRMCHLTGVRPRSSIA